MIDCEMSGADPTRHAILELAAYEIAIKDNQLVVGEHIHAHVNAFEGAEFDKKAMEVNRIIPDHPLRFAISEKDAIQKMGEFIQQCVTKHRCHRAILIGHNVHFDLAFLLASQERTGLNMVHHNFCVLDTTTLGMFFYQENVLAKVFRKSKVEFDVQQAHGALYDAMKTAELFTHFYNQYSPCFKKSLKE